MRAIRARHAYDGESFLGAGATVLVDDGLIIGVESYGFQVPGDCLVTGYEGTLLVRRRALSGRPMRFRIRSMLAVHFQTPRDLKERFEVPIIKRTEVPRFLLDQ